jgi:multidrug efflux pump subunit AcrA (membrane-fusion protein)
MFATIYFDANIGEDVLTVPAAALVQTGERNIVFHRHEDGALHPHEVVVGARAGDRVQIIRGLEEGEVIVASANFLVDAESRLAATGGSMPGMQHAGQASATEPEEETKEHRHD